MNWLVFRSFAQQARFTFLVLALLVCLAIQRSCQPAEAAPLVAWSPAVLLPPAPCADTLLVEKGNLSRKALPQARWRLVPGPAYLVYPLPRKPSQAQLDEAARAAARAKK